MTQTSTARFAPTTTIDAATLTGLYRLLGDNPGQDGTMEVSKRALRAF